MFNLMVSFWINLWFLSGMLATTFQSTLLGGENSKRWQKPHSGLIEESSEKTNANLLEGEFNALWEFYNSTNGAAWNWRTVTSTAQIWNFTESKPNPCYDYWQGITCSCQLQYCVLKELFLPLYGLDGSLPSSIGVWSSLYRINLEENYLSGSIPNTIKNWTVLSELNFYFNLLTGPIPSSIGNLTKLRTLNLSLNRLSHSLPSEMESLLELYTLQIGSNFFTGSLPAWIGHLTNLVELSAYACGLNGNLPSSLWEMKNLSVLDMNSNRFVGTIPSEISSLVNLTELNLYNNELTGYIPSSIGSLTQLRVLILASNHFNGSIPSTVGNLKTLEVLDFGANVLTWSAPSWIGNLTKLIKLGLSYNHLGPSIPSEVANLVQLSTLQINSNEFTGSLPTWIGDLTNLVELRASVNRFNGSLPHTLGELKALEYLYLNENLFTGTVPLSISNLTHLIELDLSVNKLVGTLPNSFGGLRRLLSLYIQENMVSGTMPSSISSLTKLKQIYLYNNNFFGGTKVFNDLVNLVYFDLTSNFFDGKCDSLLNNSTNLQEVGLATNLLSGNLPVYTGSKLRSFRFYNTSVNYFTGSISNNFSSFSRLELFAVGSNYLSGAVPNVFFTEELEDLVGFNVSNNLLSGSFLSEYEREYAEYPRVLQEITIDSNFLTGTLPSNLSAFAETLVIFSFNNNQFSGTVPQSYQQFVVLNEFFAQNNNLEGSITVLLNSTLPKSVVSIDLSNNEFTGFMSASFFIDNNNLSTFAAVANCLSGSIPDSICTVQSLTALALDGISTADKCRHYIFPHTSFNGFYTRYFLPGTIPYCLFSIPSLQSLHLSGNGHTGSFPDSLNISKSLEYLSLSHNVLTGTIPEYVQEHSWSNLDLSYNKFTGTLSASLTLSENASLSLQVNRLSGSVPSKLKDLEAINILDGNIFACNSNNELPEHDPTTATYSCGSNSTNYFLFSCLSLIGFGVLTFTVRSIHDNLSCRKKPVDDVLVFGKSFQMAAFAANRNIRSINDHENQNVEEKDEEGEKGRSFSSTWEIIDVYHSSFSQFAVDNPTSNLAVFWELLDLIRKGFATFACISILFLLPLYLTATVFTHSYSNEYVWVVSAILLSGQHAALMLFFAFLCLAGAYLFIFIRPPVENKFISANIHGEVYPGKEDQRHQQVSSNFGKFVLEATLLRVIVLLLDVSLFGFADILYVLIVINYNSSVIALATVALSGFKLLANNVILWKAIPTVWKLIEYCRLVVFRVEILKDPSPAIRTPYKFTVPDIAFLERLTLLNNIILRILAILVILPDCFFNALFTAPAVSSSYSYINCSNYVSLHGSKPGFSRNCGASEQQTSFSPPFIYSYQCSSKILINYAPVYIVKFIYIGFFRPLRLLFWKCCYYYSLKYYGPTSNLFRISKRLLPRILRNLETEKQGDGPTILYSKLSLTTQLSSYLAIIIVFGGLFPPLAVIGCISVIIMTYCEQLLIGRVLYESNRLGCPWYKDKLELDCKDIKPLVNLTFRSTLLIMCLFFAYLLFDTWGDEDGPISALPVTCIMASIPFIVLLFYKLFKVPRGKRVIQESVESKKCTETKDSQNSKNAQNPPPDIELTTHSGVANPLTKEMN
jgi:Leucine-rich repeat (LRR) protein